MYGEVEESFWPRIFLTVSHLSAIVISAWLLFGGGIGRVTYEFGLAWPIGDNWRRVLILFCSTVYFIRIILTSFVLLERKMSWGEALTITIWLYLFNIVFAAGGGIERRPVGPIAVCGVLLYLVGSYLNTWAEYSRYLWKRKAENRGRLYTGGLFSYSVHINYFGDLVLFIGFALITDNPWALLIPALMFFLFIFINIPVLDRYLAGKYGEAFEEYRRKTKEFIPFVY